MKKFLIIVFAVASILGEASAQFITTPDTSYYQGFLTDSKGVPLNDVLPAKLTLINDLSQRFEIFNDNVQVVNGYFTLPVWLESGSLGEFIYIGQNLSLEIEIDGKVFDPPVRIVSVPFSKVAQTADSSLRISDAAITDAKVAANAAISGSKINPDFGNQIIMTTAGININGYSIDGIYHETDLGSDSPTALATQQSIKAYVDAMTSGGAQDLGQVLTIGNDAGGLAITNMADPVNPQDAATKAYVDANSSLYTAGTGIDITGTVISNTGDTDASDDILIGSVAGGDLAGTYPDPTIAQKGATAGQVLKWDGTNWIASDDDLSNVISNPRLSGDGTAGDPLDIAQNGATNGQVLKWDGTIWTPNDDDNTTYTAGTGISITGTTIDNTGDTDDTDDIIIGSNAGGDLTGTYPDPTIDQKGATVDQILKWSGTAWQPADDDNTTYTAGTGISITGTTIDNTGDTDDTDDIIIGTNAGGDLTGTYPDPTIAQKGATNGQMLKWNGTSWMPADDDPGTDDQTLAEVLAQGNDANTSRITNLSDPTANQDAATKAYVDANDTDDQALSYNGTTNILTLEDGGNVDLSNLDDPGTDDQTLAEVLAQGNDANSSRIVNLSDPTANQDAATKAYVDANDTDDQALSYNGTTNILTLEDGGNVDLSNLDDPGTDDQALSYNGTTNILTLEDGGNVDLSNLDDPGTDDQTLAEVLAQGNDANSSRIVNLSDPTANQDAATKAYVDNAAYLNVQNGLTKTGSDIELGGDLTRNTTIDLETFNLVYDLNGTGELDIRDNGTSALFVQDDGNVGVGTNTPSNQLHVNSTDPLRLEGLQSGGDSVLTVDANGVVYYTNAEDFGSVKEIDDLLDGKTDATSVFLGDNAGANDDGSNENTAVGINAMRDNTSGRYLIAFGKDALISNTTGNENIAIGGQTLRANTTGQSNIAIGSRVLENSNATSNTAIGWFSMRLTTSGGGNTAVGSAALEQNTTGTANVAVGGNANRYNTSGDQNTSLGSSALSHNVTGNGNVAIGYLSAQGSTGASNISGNTLIGHGTGSNFLTGADNNILIGYNTGDNITTGSDNIIIGYDLDAASATGTDELNIGDLITGDMSAGTVTFNNAYTFPSADGTTDQILQTDGSGSLSWTDGSWAEEIDDLLDGKTDNTSVFLGNNAGVNDDGDNWNTGVGIDILSNNTSGVQNTAVGFQAMRLNTTGNYNTAIGRAALLSNTSGGQNTAVGNAALGANTTGQINTAMGNDALYSNTTGSTNTAIGLSSLRNNTTGWYNFGGGYSALGRNTSGSNNTAIGYQAGVGGVVGGSDYSNNVIVGSQAGILMETGADNNILLGYQAGDNITTGSDNIIIGYDLDAASDTGTDQLNIGDLISGDMSAGTVTFNNAYTFPSTDGTADQFLQTDGGGTLSWVDGSFAEEIDDLLDGATDATSVFLGDNAGANDDGDNENVGLGIDALTANTSGLHNTAIGWKVLDLNTDGNWNTGVGHNTLGANTSGTNNTGVGLSALSNNSTGADNTALGTTTLYTNSTGQSNTAVGAYALRNVTTGSNNTAVGRGALQSQAGSTAGSNTAMGYHAMIDNTTGPSNSAFGVYALRDNTTAARNTGIGYGALIYNETGINNTALGFYAGQGDDGLSNVSNNVFVGYQTGVAVLTGADNNTFVGYMAGDNVTTGSDNIIIGFNVDADNATGSDQLNIGNLIEGDMSAGTVTFNNAYTFPAADGTADQVLITNGSGVISWGDAAAGGGAFETNTNVTSNSPGTLGTDDFVFGSDQLADDDDATHDNRFWFDKSKGAFRAGIDSENNWDDANVGTVSFAAGWNTRASGLGAVVSGGRQNLASGQYAVVAGGISDTATGTQSFIGGGSENVASGGNAVVVAGRLNHATNDWAFIGGGNSNLASGNTSTIAGGQQDTASGLRSTVGGGYRNVASGSTSTIAGGTDNTASSGSDFVGGGQRNTASGGGSVVTGGTDNVSDGLFSVVGGGSLNSSLGDRSVVGGGHRNYIPGTASYAAIMGGNIDTVLASSSIIGGGQNNKVTSSYSGVFTGLNNEVSAMNAYIGGGEDNSVSQNHSAIGGGDNNVITGAYSAIPGGAYLTLGAGSFGFRGRIGNPASAFDASGEQNTFHIVDASFHHNTNNSDADFAVDGQSVDDLIFADASEDKVGIGTNTPQAELHVEGAVIMKYNSSSANTNVTIPDGTGVFKFTGWTANRTLSGPSAYEGQVLYISNSTGFYATGDFSLDPNEGATFVYDGSSWLKVGSTN